MKSRIVLFLALATTAVTATRTQVPRNDFSLALSPPRVSMAKGDSATVLVSITRSKLFTKGRAAFGFSSPETNGIIVALKNEGTDSCILKISVANTTEPGTYSLVPNCTVRGKTIGAVLKVIITP